MSDEIESTVTRHIERTPPAPQQGPYTRAAMTARLAELEGYQLAIAAELPLLRAALGKGPRKRMGPRNRTGLPEWIRLVEANPGWTADELSRLAGSSGSASLGKLADAGEIERRGPRPCRYWAAVRTAADGDAVARAPFPVAAESMMRPRPPAAAPVELVADDRQPPKIYLGSVELHGVSTPRYESPDIDAIADCGKAGATRPIAGADEGEP